jgi:hypothetical protein
MSHVYNDYHQSRYRLQQRAKGLKGNLIYLNKYALFSELKNDRIQEMNEEDLKTIIKNMFEEKYHCYVYAELVAYIQKREKHIHKAIQAMQEEDISSQTNEG